MLYHTAPTDGCVAQVRCVSYLTQQYAYLREQHDWRKRDHSGAGTEASVDYYFVQFIVLGVREDKNAAAVFRMQNLAYETFVIQSSVA